MTTPARTGAQPRTPQPSHDHPGRKPGPSPQRPSTNRLVLPFPTLPIRRTTSQATPVPCVYILASRRNGTLYVGVSSDLTRRVWEHKQDLVAGLTKRHQAHILAWFEVHGSMAAALHWEKAIRAWRRAWKLALIEEDNPEWRDL